MVVKAWNRKTITWRY